MEVMTDHFFPERQLWEPWVRVEDHINTGFVLVRPTAPVRALIADFVNMHWENEHAGVQDSAKGGAVETGSSDLDHSLYSFIT